MKCTSLLRHNHLADFADKNVSICMMHYDNEYAQCTIPHYYNLIYLNQLNCIKYVCVEGLLNNVNGIQGGWHLLRNKVWVKVQKVGLHDPIQFFILKSVISEKASERFIKKQRESVFSANLSLSHQLFSYSISLSLSLPPFLFLSFLKSSVRKILWNHVNPALRNKI